MRDACENCVFWDQSRKDQWTGFCRRYAPSSPTTKPPYSVDLSELWPRTGRAAWCGEFKARDKQGNSDSERLDRAILDAGFDKNPATVAALKAVVNQSLIWSKARPTIPGRYLVRSPMREPWLEEYMYTATLTGQIEYRGYAPGELEFKGPLP